MAEGRSSRTSAMRLPMQVLNLCGLLTNQCKTIVLSDQANVLAIEIFKVCLVSCSILAKSDASHSSKRGMVILFNGVTLDFAVIKTTDGGPL